MTQRKLDYYYLPHSTSPEKQSSCGISFLDLPYQIRHRIYLLSGLVRFCPINLNQEGPRARAHRHLNHNSNGGVNPLIIDNTCFFESRKFMGKHYEINCMPGCKCRPLPSSLLYVSRAVSEEVSRILYSENVFTISRSDFWGLKPLHNLTPIALSCLRSLTVRLNNCRCVYGKVVCQYWKDEGEPLEPLGLFPCHPMCQSYGVHDKALQKQARQHVAVLKEWQEVVNKLAAHCQRESLHLDLICDTQDMETAEDFVSQLSGLSNLKSCSIRLSQSPSWKHSVLARQAASQLVGQPPEEDVSENTPKTYYLPPEILMQILKYSDLVAPFDLEWRPDKGLVPFDCCKNCTATLDCCTCSFYHGAYSYSCTCWRVPVSIFLVSRQVYVIAMQIFYKQNRFIILPGGWRVDDMSSCYGALPAITEFFQKLPPAAAPLLRSIGLALPHLEQESAASYGRLLAKWQASLAPLTTQCNVPKLSTAIYAAYRYKYFRGPTERKAAELKRTYQPLMKALEPLCVDGLQDLFVYIEWQNNPVVDRMSRSVSSELETEVMGSGYDSEARGKWTCLRRLWYDGESREGPVFAADGRQVWPMEYGDDAFEPVSEPPWTYIV